MGSGYSDCLVVSVVVGISRRHLVPRRIKSHFLFWRMSCCFMRRILPKILFAGRPGPGRGSALGLSVFDQLLSCTDLFRIVKGLTTEHFGRICLSEISLIPERQAHVR